MHQHTYYISGMTCDGCRTQIENKLNEIPGINVRISLEEEKAEIESEDHLELAKLQEKISEISSNYQIHERAHSHHPNPPKQVDDSPSGQYICPMF